MIRLAEEEAAGEAKIMAQLSEEKEKADRSWVKGAKEGYDELEKRSKDYATLSKTFLLDAYSAAERGLSVTFFNAMTGKFKDLEDVVDNFGKAVVQAFADMSAKLVAGTAWQFLTGQGGGGLGGILGGLGNLFSGISGGGGGGSS